MVNFETDETSQERDIEAATQDITDLFRQAEQLLSKFGAQAADKTLTIEERTLRYNIQRSIAKKLQTLSMTFRSSQKVKKLHETVVFVHSYM